MKWILSASVALLWLALAAAPAGSQTLLSQTTWGGAGSDAASGIAVAADGSSYIVGISDSFAIDQFGQPQAGISLVKFAPNGSLVWQRVWNGTTISGFLVGPAVALGADGSVYVTGNTQTNGGDAVLLKFDPLGTLIWQRTWGGTAFDVSNAVATSADGSVYITGTSQSFGASGISLFVVKFGATGSLIWQKIWDGAEGEAIAVASDGSVYAAGSMARPGGLGNFDVLALKITALGALVWQRTYSAGDVVDARAGMTVAPDGSVYIAGALQAPKMQFVDIAAILIKLSPDGGLVFDTQWGGRNGDEASGVAVAPDSSVYIAGHSGSFGAGLGDAFVLHLSSTGRSADAATWGGTGFDEGRGVGVAQDGTVVLAATASSPPYSFLSAPRKTSMVKSTMAVPAGTLATVAGTVTTTLSPVINSNGTTTFGGNADQALVRIRPAP
jgi:hypothetical protein